MKTTQKQTLQGEVVSNKMQKTIVVEVARYIKHPKYQKYYTVNKKFKAHDEKGECQIGDIVIIESTRPLSKDKNFTFKSKVK